MTLELMDTSRGAAHRQLPSSGADPVIPLATLFVPSAPTCADTRLAGRTAFRRIDRTLLRRHGDLAEQVARLQAQTSSTSGESEVLRSRLEAMQNSPSCRLTSPLRAVAPLFSRA